MPIEMPGGDSPTEATPPADDAVRLLAVSEESPGANTQPGTRQEEEAPFRPPERSFIFKSGPARGTRRPQSDATIRLGRPGRVRFVEASNEEASAHPVFSPKSTSHSSLPRAFPPRSSSGSEEPTQRVPQNHPLQKERLDGEPGGAVSQKKQVQVGRSKWAVVKKSLPDLKGENAVQATDAERLQASDSAVDPKEKIPEPPPQSRLGASVRFPTPEGHNAGVPRRAKLARQSVILCMDPMCNRCPPEMHMHRNMKAAGAGVGPAPPPPGAGPAPGSASSTSVGSDGSGTLGKTSKRKYNLADFADLDEEAGMDEGEKEQSVVVIVRCCGLKFTFTRRQNYFSMLRRSLIPLVFNPHNRHVRIWSRVFVTVSLCTFFLDPLFLYAVSFNQNNFCAYTQWVLLYILTAMRSAIDALTLIHMFMQSRMAFNATQAHVRDGTIHNAWGDAVKVGELVIDDRRAILYNYLRTFFLWDILSLIPYPQVLLLAILPHLQAGQLQSSWQVLLRLSVLWQFVPRIRRLQPVFADTGAYNILNSAWSSFMLNLFTFSMASHVIGAVWFVLAEQRVSWCFNAVCSASTVGCRSAYLTCPHNQGPSSPAQAAWVATQEAAVCFNGTSPPVNYGMYSNGVQAVFLTNPIQQWLYTIMWGFQQVSTFAGNLVATTLVGEVLFMLFIIALGLFLFALLIGNMQNFLQALGRRAMEHRLHMRDVENWMRQREIPRELQRRVRQLEQYAWTVSQGVNEEEVLSGLTEDIQRDVRRHLSLELIKKSYLFAVMDDIVLDAICERLRSRLFINGTVVIREGYPVTRMFFVLRGQMRSSTTNKGRTGFFESVTLNNGDFFGEELLVYFIEKYAGEQSGGRQRRRASLRRDVKVPSLAQDLLPKSERTVVCMGPVDGFSLEAEDIEFVCFQFNRVMQSGKVQRALNICSKNRRTRAATTIQVWYRALLRRRLEIPLEIMYQAIRTKRIGALIREAQEEDDSCPDGTPLLPVDPGSQAEGGPEDAGPPTELPRRAASWNGPRSKKWKWGKGSPSQALRPSTSTDRNDGSGQARSQSRVRSFLSAPQWLRREPSGELSNGGQQAEGSGDEGRKFEFEW